VRFPERAATTVPARWGDDWSATVARFLFCSVLFCFDPLDPAHPLHVMFSKAFACLSVRNQREIACLHFFIRVDS
jgi:hypothetical protein